MMISRTARVVLPAFVVYTIFTVVTERVGFDSVNRVLTWPSVLLYLLPGYLAAMHGSFRGAVLIGTLMSMALMISGVVLLLGGAFEPIYPPRSARVAAYTVVGGLIFAVAGSILGAFVQRRFAAWAARGGTRRMDARRTE